MDRQDRKFRSCLISAPFGVDLGNLPRILDRAGIQWEWAKSELAYTERRPGDLRKTIRGVDLVIGVLFGAPSDASTMLEIGIAVGFGKPVLLIAVPIAAPLYNLEAFPHVKASLSDDAAISLHLDLLMQNVLRGFRYPTLGQSRITSSSPALNVGPFQKTLHGDRRPESALEAAVVDVIENAGGRVLLHPRRGEPSEGFTPDLLFWLPTQDAEFLNPAVMEVTRHQIMAPRFEELEQRLVGFLRNTGVRTGLIVSRNLGSKRPIGLRGGPSLAVFFVDFDEFLELVRSGKLADHLRQERNRAAHGLR